MAEVFTLPPLPYAYDVSQKPHNMKSSALYFADDPPIGA